MLPASHRLTESVTFRRVTRSGRRASTRTLVAYCSAPAPGAPAVSRAGFVVSKQVGNAVVRNRVKRRLRHLVHARLVGLPAGSLLVVRALPAAAEASYDALGSDLDRCLQRLDG